MDSGLNIDGFDRFVDDRPRDKVFRLDRSIYLDEWVFEAEMRNIFERTWQYLCHESQIAGRGAYFSTYIGRQPVFAMRQKDGSVRAFINACSHRGAILTPLKQGKAGNALTCRFHGWSYAPDGRCIRVKNEETGYGEGFDRACYDLKALPRVGSYKGFVFASLTPDVPPLEEHLGEAARFLEFVADQSAEGMVVLPGSQSYVVAGNWKLQSENAVDGYHTSTVHRVFANTVRHREQRDGLTGMMRTETGRLSEGVRDGSYDLGRGHMAIWADRAPPDVSPLYEAKDRLERDHPKAKVDWMLGRGRNLVVFPTLMVNDFAATQIRVFRPIAVDRTEVAIYCLAPKEESGEARYARLRKFEDFFMVSGMATSDDVMALEAAQEGSHGRRARWGEFHRGMETLMAGPDEAAREGGFTPVSSNTTWDQETLFHGFYREWRRLMSNGHG